MLDTLALIVVLVVGIYFVGLAAVSLAAPAQATRFLMGFASSAGAHYAELLIRLAAGGAFLLRAPHMSFPLVFTVFGWMLVLTTAGLFAIPWRWHHRFAQQVVPLVVHRLELLAIASLAAGGFVLAAAILGGGG